MAFEPPIPGQTPIDDVSGLKKKHIRTQAEINALEAENVRRAVVKYLLSRPSRRRARFDAAWAKRLHAEMFGGVWTWAGALRRRELNRGTAPHLIETELSSLFADLKSWEQSGMPPLECSARLHHRAVNIHPFLNGNGRWSRMLANIYLKLHGQPLVEWPETTIGDASNVREEYLEALRTADRGNYAPLLDLHARFIGKG